MTSFIPQRVNLGSQGVGKVLGDCEAQIAEILWKQGSLSVRDVCDALSDNGRELSFNATMTIMNRMVEKRILAKKKERGQGSFVYSPRTDRRTFLQRIAKEVFRRVLSDPELFTAAGFADALTALPKGEQQEIRRLLERKKQ